MTELKAIIFDMDGLLVDSETVYYEGTQQIADEFGLPFTKETYLAGLGISDEELHLFYHKLYDDQIGYQEVERFIVVSYAHCVTLFQAGRAQLKSGARELLAFCHEKKIATVVASSNSRELITLLLEKTGIFNQFQAIFSVEDVHRAKPDPALFLAAAKHLGYDKESLLVLEDSKNGLIAANQAGIPVIMIPDLLPAPADVPVLTVLPQLDSVPAFLLKNYQFGDD
ncbi:HAD family hydrolase [Enterococcus camelliae]|uniref:HAD family hydrolase n=1 Tax=Enterococcus camelliae TaxID=453959 RepID=A0ABW5THP3_9ENTE